MSDELTYRQAFTYLMSGSCILDGGNDYYCMKGDTIYWWDTDEEAPFWRECSRYDSHGILIRPLRKADPPEEPQKEYTFEELLNAKKVTIHVPTMEKLSTYTRGGGIQPSSWTVTQMFVFDMAIRHKWRIEVEG